jgi:hypothetical protein
MPTGSRNHGFSSRTWMAIAKNRGRRNHVEDNTQELDDPDSEYKVHRKADVNRCLHRGSQLHDFHAAVEEQEQYGKSADHASRPQTYFSAGSTLDVWLHDFCPQPSDGG